MRSSHSKRLAQIEKKLNAVDLRIIKFKEADVERAILFCDKIDKQFPGIFTFIHPGLDDLQECGKIWYGAMAKIIAFAEIKGQLEETGMKEFIEGELGISLWFESS